MEYYTAIHAQILWILYIILSAYFFRGHFRGKQGEGFFQKMCRFYGKRDVGVIELKKARNMQASNVGGMRGGEWSRWFVVNFLSSRRVEIDIHDMHREEAKKYLEQFLSKANGNVKEVVVIHGYSSGTVLRDMVRTKLKHHRIRSKELSLNPGITTLYLF